MYGGMSPAEWRVKRLGQCIGGLRYDNKTIQVVNLISTTVFVLFPCNHNLCFRFFASSVFFLWVKQTLYERTIAFFFIAIIAIIFLLITWMICIMGDGVCINRKSIKDETKWVGYFCFIVSIVPIGRTIIRIRVRRWFTTLITMLLTMMCA